MPTYTGSFPKAAQGLAVTVKTPAGASLVDPAPGSVGSTVNEDGALTYSYAYDYGDDSTVLSASVTSSALGTFATRLTLDTSESVAAGGSGVAADETAYFIATGPVYLTDGGGSAGSVVLEADDRQDALPDWASVVGGAVVLTDDAGTCAYNFAGVMDFDFSDTTPPTSDGTISGSFTLNIANDPLNVSDSTEGDGGDEQTSDPARSLGVCGPGDFSIDAFPTADDGGNIPDGEATPRVALTITRVAQAAVLPD